MLRVWLCGRIAAEVDGVPLAMPASERARALLGWIALHPGTAPRAELAARLWPDSTDAQARASLRTAIWALRQAWGETGALLLLGSKNTFGLSQDGLWVDALAAEGVTQSGSLLPGVEDDWASAAREEHRLRVLDRLERQSIEAGEQGHTGDAVAYARERCVLAPLNEAAHRDYLRLLEAAGDRAGALLAARDFADRLKTELGIEPAPATRALEAELRGAPPIPARPRLFGRSGQLRALTTAWQAAAGGAGQVVVLTGEAGIGKTSLLAEMCHRAVTTGGRTGVGTGTDASGETPFAAWLEIVQSLVATVAPVPRSKTWPAELNRLSPDLGARLGRPESPAFGGAPELERLRLFEAVLRLVEWACSDLPLLLAIDDAHRSDRASLRLLAHIGRRLAGLPLLIVLTRRDRPKRAEVDMLMTDLVSRQIQVSDIELGPLVERDLAALACSLRRFDDDELQRIVTAAEGNPLLAVESVRALAAGADAPPPNLLTAVRSVLGTLPPDGQALARVLAVAARALVPDEVDRLSAALRAGEHAGIESGLLARTVSGLGFRHELLRQAVVRDLADPALLHDRLATVIEQTNHVELAGHLAAAGRTAAAAREWAAAAAYARSVGALAEAEEALGKAIECAPTDGALWLELEEIHAWQGRREAMEQAWDRALALLPTAALPAAWARRGRQFRSVSCHPDAALAAYQRALPLLDDESLPALRADVLIGLAWGQAVAGDPGRAQGLLAAAERLLPAPAKPEIRCDIAEIRVLGLIRQGRFAQCAALAYAMEPSPLGPLAYPLLINAACALTCAGDFEGALALADRAVDLTEAVPALLPGCLAARAYLLARLERHDEAAATAQRQRDCAERLDSATFTATAAHDAGMVALAGGRYRVAADLLAAALSGEPSASRPAAMLALAESMVRAGDADGAARQVRAAALEPVRPADKAWALVPRMAKVQGLIAAARGEEELARRRYDEAARGWRDLLAEMNAAQIDGYFSSLVDLGRPPVLGLVEPARELALIERDRLALNRIPPVSEEPCRHSN